jgi:hypothetical protein
MSMKIGQESGGSGYSYEPLNPEQRRRDLGVPVGLKNVGNSISSKVYIFSMLLQFLVANVFLLARICERDSSLLTARKGRSQS